MLDNIRPRRESEAFRVKGTQTLDKIQDPADYALQKKLRTQFDYAIYFTVEDGKAILHPGMKTYSGAGKTYFKHGNRPFDLDMAYRHLNMWLASERTLAPHKAKTNPESTSMSKTNQFVNTVKDIFGNVVRMQRGRAAVHATKRIIFSAFPIKWGVLARITGKAKSVENHPLTDVAVALLAHGAANALLDDPAKRAKYLKYTEEMVAASVANAGFKMVPVEELLDKVLKGAIDSEAMQKVKGILSDEK